MKSLYIIFQIAICSVIVHFFSNCFAAEKSETHQQMIQKSTQINKADYIGQELIYVESNEEIVVTVTSPGRNKPDFTVTCYDMTGSVLWKKPVYLLKRIFLGKSPNRILIAHGASRGETRTYTCFNQNGNELWSKTIILSGFAISESGKYGITMKTNADEGAGRFQVFDMETGAEIPANIPQDYSYFHAAFLNDSQAIVLLQKYYTVTDKEHVKIYQQKIDELYDKARQNAASNRVKIDKDEYLRLRRELRKGTQAKFLPVKFLIYDINSRSVVFEKEIITESGVDLWCQRFWYGNISVNPAGNIVALHFSFGEPTVLGSPSALYVMNIQGQELYFDTEVERIKSLKFVDDKSLLVNHSRRSNLFSLYNIEQHEKNWTYDLKDAPDGWIRNINKYGEILLFDCYSNMKYKIVNSQLNIKTGEIVGEPFGNHILCKITREKIFLVDKSAKIITFYEKAQGVNNE